MNRKDIWQEIELELRASKKKHPNWPDHIVAQAGIVCEESGELIRECLNQKYEKALPDDPDKKKKIWNKKKELKKKQFIQLQLQ